MRGRTLLLAILAIVLHDSEVVAAGMKSETSDPLVVVRAVDSELRRLILEGHDRSATIRRLVHDIQQRGWLVFVQPGRCPEKAAAACLLHFVGTYEGTRFVRLLVPPHGRHPDQVIATIAHELQHVWEVAQDPRVTDAATMRALFQRIGRVSVQSPRRTTYETTAAVAVGGQVLSELRQTRRRSATR